MESKMKRYGEGGAIGKRDYVSTGWGGMIRRPMEPCGSGAIHLRDIRVYMRARGALFRETGETEIRCEFLSNCGRQEVFFPAPKVGRPRFKTPGGPPFPESGAAPRNRRFSKRSQIKARRE